jgi:hypothetical protein
VNWRFYLAIPGALAALALALGASAGSSLRSASLAVAAAAVLVPGVAALVLFLSGATRAHIEASNAAFRAISAATHLTYRQLEKVAPGYPAYAFLTGKYREAAVEITLAGYHGGPPLRTTIRIRDFPTAEHAARLRHLAQGKVDIDLPEPQSLPTGTRLPPSDVRLAELLTSIASEANGVVLDHAGFSIFVRPRRSVFRWLTDFTDFDIETDPVRLRAMLDRALDLTEALNAAEVRRDSRYRPSEDP